MKKLLITLLFFMPFIVTAETKMATVFHPETGHRKAVVVGDKHAFNGGYLLEIAQVKTIPKDMLGISVVTDYSKNLSSSMNSTQTTVPVTSITTKDNHVLIMGDLGSKVFLVIEPGARKEEIVMCTGISGTTWTGCTRGLAFYGTSTASVAVNRKTHSAGSTVIISNTHYIYDELMDKESTETIDGDKTFNGQLDIPNYLPTSTTSAPTTDGTLTNKLYVDNTVNQGAATGTETTSGIWEGATRIEMASSTNTGGQGNLILQSQYASSTPTVNNHIIPITKIDGKLDQNYLDLTEDFSFSGETIIASSTMNATTTFINFPIMRSEKTPYDDEQLTSKKYVDDNNNYSLLNVASTTNVITDSAVENTYAQATIPANGLGTNNAIKFTIYYSNMNNNNTASDLVFRLKYGGSTLATVTENETIASGDAYDGTISGILSNAASTSAQFGNIFINGKKSGSGAGDVFFEVNSGTSAVDSTSDQTLLITGDLNQVNADITIEHFAIELIKF